MTNKSANIKTLCGIVTFNSDATRLVENVSAAYPQVDKLVIFDNGSTNIDAIKEALRDFKDIRYFLSKTNQGIAKALFEIMGYAKNNNYDWVLTLDDDSVAKPNLVENYRKYINVNNIGAMTCKMEDRNYPMNEKDIKGDYELVDTIITSGCFMSVDAYSKTSGYDVNLFIDRVDTDICYSLVENKYKLIKINYVGLLHEMGYGKIRKFLWHNARAVNYSPVRRYYIFRNEVIVRAKHKNLIKREWLESGRPMWINFFLSSLKILLYEENKFTKIKQSWKGWMDGKKYVKEYLKNNSV